MSTTVAVVCVSTSEKVVNHCTIRVQATASVADLKAAMQRALGCDGKKAVQVLVGGAVPSDASKIGDLVAAYACSENGQLRVNYSVEGHFGGSCAGSPLVCLGQF